MVPLIIIGFTMAIMATLGIALLFLGEVPFIAGKRIPAGRSRLIGLVLFGFSPLALGVVQVLTVLFGRDTIDGQAVIWTVFGVCWFVVVVLLFRVVVPKRERRPAANAKESGTKKNPFGGAAVEDEPIEIIDEAEEPVPVKKTPPKDTKPAGIGKTPAKKAPKPSAEENNPFDFA